MAEIVYGVAASLDGFIAPPDGSADWLAPFGAAGQEHVREFLKTVGAIVMGSRTYEQALSFGGGVSMGKPCYVLSSRRLPAAADVTVTPASPRELVDELDRRGIARAWHFGGAKSFAAFRDAGLITGYSLGIVPVVLGGGSPLFQSPGRPERLRLVKSKPHPSGVLMVEYRVVREGAPAPEKGRKKRVRGSAS
jgi:dihydrofolate reductase